MLGLFVAAGPTAYYLLRAPAQPVPQSTTPVSHTVVPDTTATYRGLPVTLKIPAINVETSIESVGLTPNGDMTAPTSPTKVGWYKYGAIPGDVGSAVIAGHVVGLKGEAAIFARLRTLHPGDLLLVVDSKGQTATFVVREIRTYNQQAQHSEVFTATSGTHLNIVTCAGDWDAKQHQYLERLVVFADKSPNS